MSILQVYAEEAEGKTVNTDEKFPLVLAAFGTTRVEAKRAYDTIEAQVRKAFPNAEIKWAYTSSIVRKRLAAATGRVVPSVDEAVESFVKKGEETIVLQSLLVVPGEEYAKTLYLSEEGKGDSHVIHGRPLLWNMQDMIEVAEALKPLAERTKVEDTALVLMGHGQETGWADAAYLALEYQFRKMGYPRVFIGMVEGPMMLEDKVIEELEASGAKKVILAPLLIVAGVHAQDDLAGDDDDSWKSILTKEGYTVVDVVLKGLGEYEAIGDIYARHILEALTEAAEEEDEDGETAAMESKSDATEYPILCCEKKNIFQRIGSLFRCRG